ncbi:hypothetical protein IT568_06440 [bacterium]|nr:hypothetical protein [bacterium]
MPKFLLTKNQKKSLSTLLKQSTKALEGKKKLQKTEQTMLEIAVKCDGENNEIIFNQDEYELLKIILKSAVVQYSEAGKRTLEDKWYHFITRIKKFFIRRMGDFYKEISQDLKIKLEQVSLTPQLPQRKYKFSKS